MNLLIIGGDNYESLFLITLVCHMGLGKVYFVTKVLFSVAKLVASPLIARDSFLLSFLSRLKYVSFVLIFNGVLIDMVQLNNILKYWLLQKTRTRVFFRSNFQPSFLRLKYVKRTLTMLDHYGLFPITINVAYKLRVLILNLVLVLIIMNVCF